MVLVVDDIFDEGVMLVVVKESFIWLGVVEVLLVVFIDKLNGKSKLIFVDFVGLIVLDCFVFGFGMDVDGVWWNLLVIYVMKED